MAIYKVTDLAGNAVRLEGPEGLSDDQVIDAYLSAQEGSAQPDAFSPDELARLAAGDPTFLDQFTEGAAGVGAGAINILGLGAKGAATLLPEDLELMVREGIITAEEAAQTLFAPELGREDLVGRKFGEALGSFIPLAGLSLAGPVGTAAAAGLATSAGAGEASERARAAGATEDERGRAAILGSVVGASELLPIKFLKALNKSGFDELIQRVTRVAQSAGVEGAQEAAAQIGQNLIAKGIYDPEQGAFTGTGESLGYGAGVGGFVQAVMDLALPRVRGASTPPPVIEEDVVPVEPPQMELFDDEQGGQVGQMDLFPEIPPEVLAELETQSPEFSGDSQLDLFEEPSPQVDIEELIAERERADIIDDFAAQQEGLPLLLGYEPTRTVEGPNGAPVELPSEIVEAARIRQQEAEQQAALEAEQARAIDEVVLASQGQDFELTPQEQFLIEMSLDNPDLTQEQLTRLAREMTVENNQPDIFPLERLLDQPTEAPVEAPVAQEEQLELPGIEPAMLQGEMFGPRGGVRRDRQDLVARPVQEEEVAPEPVAAVQPELAGIEPVEKQGEMFGPRGGIPRKPKPQAPVVPSQPKMVVNKELLKALGVSPNAAVVKRLTTKEYDLNVEQDRAVVAKELVAYARLPAVATPTKNKINNFVNNIAPAQRDMFSRTERSAPKKKAVVEVPKKGPTITPEAKVDIKQKLEAKAKAKQEVKPVPTQGETQNVQPVNTKPAAVRGRPKSDSGSKTSPKSQGSKTKSTPTRTTTPVGTGLEPAVDDTRSVRGGEVAGGGSLGNKRTGKANRQSLPKEDGDKIARVVRRKPQNAKKEGVSEAVSAKRYFEKYNNTGDALYRVAYDATVGLSDKEANVTTDPVVKKLLEGTSTEVAQKTIQWVRKNLSADTNAQLDKYIAEVEKENSRDISKEVEARNDAAKKQRKIDKALSKNNRSEGEKQWAVADRLERIQKRKAERANARLADDAVAILDDDVSFEGGVDDLGTLLNLIEDGVDSLVVRSHPIVATLLKTGQLKSALNAIAATTSDLNVTRIADKLAANIGDAKIKIAPVDSMEAIGTYSPKTNTITIREDAIDSTHALLHEAAHAVTQATLRNKSHPLTKRLQKIFNDIGPRLAESKQYGSLSLDEFVAEYFGNEYLRVELATMFPRNSDKSMLTKMTDSIINFLKKALGLTATRGMTIEQLDELMMGVVAPSVETRNAAELLYNPKLAADAISETYKKAAGLADSAVDKFIGKSKTAESVWDESVETKKTITQMAKDGVLGALPLASLTNIAKKYLPKLAEEFNTKFNLYKGEIDKAISSIGNGVVKDFSDWNKANPDKYPTMKKVLLEGSLAEIDFRKPESEYKGEKLEAYKKLLPMYKALGADGQKQYKAVRATYDRLYNDLLSAFRSDVEKTTGDTKLATKLHNEFYNRLITKGGLEGYFPLRRQGKYLLSFSFVDENGKTRDAFEMYESSRERDERKALLESSGIVVDGTLKTPLQLKASAFEGSDPSSFVGSVLEVLKANNVEKQTLEQIMRLAVELSPQNSLARMLAKRSGKAGFNDDVNEVFKDTAVGLSKRVASLKFRSDLNKLQTDIDAYVRENAEQDTPDGRRIKFYGDELQRRLELAKDPNMPAWANLIKSTTYLYTLGFNASSALIDMAAIPMVLYPQLKGSYPKADVWKIIGAAMNDYMKSGRTHYVESYLTEGLSGEKLQAALDAAGLADRDIKARKEIQSIVNYNFRDKALPANIKELKELVDLMIERGQVQRVSFFDDLEAIGENKFMSKFNTYQGAMMQISERARREVTMVAKYRLEIDKMRQEGRTIDKAARMEAAESALTLSQLTNGSTSMLEGSRFGQHPIGSIAFMYKNYGARMMALQFDMFDRMTKGETSEIRAEARNQLGLTLGMAAIFSGVRGMPMVGVVALLYNMYKDDEDDDFDTMLYKNLGTLGARGAVDSLTGMSVSQRIALTDMIYRSDGMNEEQSPAEIFWTTLGGPTAGTIDKLDRAGDAFAKGNWERGIEGMMPASIANLMKATRFNFEGARTLKGDLITDDIGPLSIFGQALGFAPTDYVRRQRFITMQKLGEASITEKRSLLFDKAYIARRNGNAEDYQEVLKEIDEFNKSLKDKTKQILPENLERSRKTRQGIDQKRIFGVTAQNPEKWRRDAAELGLEI